MPTIALQRTVDLSPIELFTVAADIEAYPEFIPNCVATRIVERKDNIWLVDNVFRWGPVPVRFRTRAVMDAPHAIDIKSIDSALIDLALNWRFKDSANGAEVTFEMTLNLPGSKFGFVEQGLRQHAQAIERAFVARAVQSSKMDK